MLSTFLLVINQPNPGSPVFEGENCTDIEGT